MYKTIHRTHLAALLASALLIAGAAAAAVGGWKHMQASASPTRQRPVIVLDAGHGGVDPGAIGVNGAEEKEINLEIALCLRDILTVNGWEVVMIREEDVSINDPQYKKISQIKTSDLKKRLSVIEEHPEGIAISIHQNHFTQEKYNGAQMFYGHKNPESKPLAEAIQSAFRENLQPGNERAVKQSTSDVYIIHNASIPTVLVECGFLSNAAECAKLCDEEYRQKTAFTIYCGLVNYQRASGVKVPA